MLDTLFSAITFASMLRLATPLILSSAGSCFGDRAGIFNIGYESFILVAAFFATLGSFQFSSAAIGILFGVLAGVVCSCIFGLFVFHFQSDGFVVSIAMNLGAWGFTTMMMSTIFGVRGSFYDPRIVSLQPLDIPVLGDISFINQVFNHQNILVYIALLSVAIAWIVMYKTPFGLRIRAIGINIRAAQSAGTNVVSYKWICAIISGVSCGLAGAVLPLGGTSAFTENMSAGRGFLVLAAILVARGNPLTSAVVCILFAYTDALSVGLETMGFASQIVQTLPYLTTILVLVVSGLRHLNGKTKRWQFH